MIFYGLIAHGTIVLAEYSSSSGNFTQVAHELLEKIPIEKDARMSLTAESYVFNYVVKKEIIYMCLVDKDFGRAIPFAFLDKLCKLFQDQYGRRAKETSVPYSFNADFAPVIRKEMEYFSADGGSKLQEVQDGLDRVKDVMQENISLVLERGEKLDNLVIQSEGLMDTSNNFRSGATRLKEQLWWNNMKMKILIGAICTVIFLFIIANACGGLTFPDCS